MSSIYNISVKSIDGKDISMSEFKGKTLLIVNVASECGFTKQYEGLQRLQDEYKAKDFQVLGFPCNQFGGQEPGTESEIKEFCSTKFNISFPMFSKVDVNGENAHPLYKFLKSNSPGVLGTEAIKWNFTKFLVSQSGEVLERFAPKTTPEEIAKKLSEYV